MASLWPHRHRLTGFAGSQNSVSIPSLDQQPATVRDDMLEVFMRMVPKYGEPHRITKIGGNIVREVGAHGAGR